MSEPHQPSNGPTPNLPLREGERSLPSSEAAYERRFHLALATAFVPIALLPVTWWLALGQRGDRRWFRATVALASLDTLLGVLLVVGAAWGSAPEAEAPAEPLRIGVELEEGAEIGGVMPGSPADRAGLKEGDRVLAVDGGAVKDSADLIQQIQATAKGQPRRLTVARNDSERDIEVTPGEVRPPRDSFAPVGGRCDPLWDKPDSGGVAVVGSGVLMVLALWLFVAVRHGPPRPRFGLVALVLLAAPLAGGVATQLACAHLGGRSVGVVLVGLVAQGSALLIGGALLWWWLRHELEPLVVGAPLSTWRACKRALLYLGAVIARGLALIAALMALAPELVGVPGAGMRPLFDQASDPAGRILLFTAAVVIAPLAEEIVFRGVLLPGLARRMKPAWALWLSAFVFGLFHVSSHGLGAVMPGLLGLVFGWARLRTGSLRAPVLLHTANNLVVTLLAWAA